MEGPETRLRSIFIVPLMQFLVGVCLFIALLNGQRDLTVLALLVLGIMIGARLWSRLGLSGIRNSSIVDKDRLFPEESLALQVSVENAKFLPVWLQMSVPVEGALESVSGKRDLTGECGLLWYQKARFNWELIAQRRGVYRVGPARIKVGDLFGFFTKGKTTGAEMQVIVYPKLVPLKPFSLPRRDLFGVPGSKSPVQDPHLYTRYQRLPALAAFFCLFMVKLLLLVKGGIEVKDPTSELLLFPFFIFSLLAIGLARNRSSTPRDFITRYKGIGVLASFTVVVLAVGAGLVLLFTPYLIAAAEAGYGVLRSIAGPLSPMLVQVLRFLFFRTRVRQEVSSSSPRGDEAELVASGESSWWGKLVARILEWGFLGLGMVMGLILCALGAWYPLRWLFSSTQKAKGRNITWKLLVWWVQGLWASLTMGLQRAVQRLKGYRGRHSFTAPS